MAVFIWFNVGPLGISLSIFWNMAWEINCVKNVKKKTNKKGTFKPFICGKILSTYIFIFLSNLCTLIGSFKSKLLRKKAFFGIFSSFTI
jgi:hypothetical protein